MDGPHALFMVTASLRVELTHDTPVAHQVHLFDYSVSIFDYLE